MKLDQKEESAVEHGWAQERKPLIIVVRDTDLFWEIYF